MTKADKDILTTADTAKLLGVSIRTAQLLIEGGSVPSWKTPGGHRRVYRSDVMTIIEGQVRPVAEQSSAIVIIICASERAESYEHVFAQLGACTIRIFQDVLAALVAVGSLKPHAIVTDAEALAADRAPLLRSLAANPALGHSMILAVGAKAHLPLDLPVRVVQVETAEDARTAISKSLQDEEKPFLEGGDCPFPIALNERQRLVALERAGLLDTAPEEAFDRLTWLAAESLQAPVALMTLLTPTRQWFKSRVGLDLPETPRSWAFCNHTIMQKQVFSVEDLSSDPRFSDNPAVVGAPGFRFYAGAPVLDENGFVVGSLCVIDYKARKLDARGAQIIQTLAALASDEVRLRTLERRSDERGSPAGTSAGKHSGAQHGQTRLDA
jgi:excisionase family DNA binding protein